MKCNPVDIIRRKRDGDTLTKAEIKFLISAYSKNQIADYQFAAFLMAVYFQGMNFSELTNFTQSMMQSGKVLNLAHIKKPKIDKHSSGGVGDKISLILAPLVASCGVCVPMISGRGLGHTGGTLDKLESIPGFRTDLTESQFKKQLKKTSVAINGQTSEIAPADKKIYALRDVTATVDSIPLISASIMSKKLAEDLDGLILDVKLGSGAFMKEHKKAKELAQTMMQIGRRSGVKVTAVLTDMNCPLGEYIGNSLEVIETIEALKGRGPRDLMEVTFVLGEEMLKLARVHGGRRLLAQKIANGEALDKFREIISVQKGDTRVINDYTRLPVAHNKLYVRARKTGYIHDTDTRQIGLLLIRLGGGRFMKDDKIDHSCGFRVHKKNGDSVQKGECLTEIYCGNRSLARSVAQQMQHVYTIKPKPCRPRKLIHEIIK